MYLKRISSKLFLTIFFLSITAVAGMGADYPDQVIATIPVGANPQGVAITPNGRYVYVADGSNVSVIQTSDNTVVKTISVGSGSSGVAITPNGRYVYVANYDSSNVSVIQTSDNTVVKTVLIPNNPNNVAVTPNGSYVYTAGYSGGMSVIQTSDNTVVKTIYPPGGNPHPYGVAVTSNGSYVYVTNNLGTVSVIQTSDNTVVKTISVGSTPYGVAITPNGRYVYVANHSSPSVFVIQTSDNTVVKTISVGSGSSGVAITPNGSYVYVTNVTSSSNNVSVIQTSDNTVVKTVPVGANPDGVAITPDGSYVYVANTWSNTVSVIGKPTSPSLSVIPDNQTVSSAADTTSFAVSNTGAGTMDWTAAVIAGGTWLSISSGSSGIDSGTITAAFTQNVDSTRTGTIRVTATGASDSPKDVTVTQAGEGEIIITTSLPSGTVGAIYGETLQAVGGIPPYTWGIISGSLPAGLLLNAITGEIFGTPTAYGINNFTVQATDSKSPPPLTATKDLSIQIKSGLAFFDITGKVVQGTGTTGLDSVFVTISNAGFTDIKTTLGDGTYRFVGIPAGTYNLISKKLGWTFTPPQINIPELDDDLVNQNFNAYLEITFTAAPSGNPNPVTKGTNTVQCTAAAQTVLGSAIIYNWTALDGYFQNTGLPTSSLQNPVWIADVAMSPFEEYKLIRIEVTASCTNGLSQTAYYFQRVNSATEPVGSGGGGGGAVGPLAVGISALLGWWKRRKQR